ncbi:MAG: PEGA domain-containing protein [Myxococcaceae bacterium]|nr:PEGA domain-containing protein [Myxococcaceae bacterium]
MVAFALMVSLAAVDDAGPSAKRYFQEGQNRYQQGRYAEAIGKFEEAYRLKPLPAIFFNIGRCWEQLGDTSKALKSYREYLKLAPDAEDRDVVVEAVTRLERKLQDKGVQQVNVVSSPTSARASIDGRYRGLTPLAVEVPPGDHRLVLEKEGYETSDTGFLLAPNKALDLEVTLKVQSTGSVVAPSVSDAPSTPRRSFLSQRKLTLVAGGVAVVAGVTGLVLGLVSNGARATLLGAVHEGAEAQRLHDQARSSAIGANVMWSVAAVALVVAVVLLFVEPRL